MGQKLRLVDMGTLPIIGTRMKYFNHLKLLPQNTNTTRAARHCKNEVHLHYLWNISKAAKNMPNSNEEQQVIHSDFTPKGHSYLII